MRWPRTLTVPRAPDFLIGPPDAPYLRRWWVIPRNRRFNVYLHHFLCSDDDRALHDHPWWNVSIVLRGSYLEHIKGHYIRRHRGVGAIVFRCAAMAHRIELIGGKPAWTLFITGPTVREWGFHCPKGWRHWREFTDSRDKGQVGKGCE